MVFLGGAEASASPSFALPMFITIKKIIILHLFLGGYAPDCEAENQSFFSKCIGAQQILSMAIMLDKIATDQQQLHW